MENRPYILVPFDFRNESVMALKAALKIGRVMHLRLEVVQFVPSHANYFVSDPGIMVGYGAAVSQLVRTRPDLPGFDAFLEIMTELNAVHRDVHFRQVEGVPGVNQLEGLSQYIEDAQPEMVVVHKDLYKDSEFLPGPIMHKLVRHNHIPVLMLEGTKNPAFKNILIPVNDQGFSSREREFISRWVESFDATVHLIYLSDGQEEEPAKILQDLEFKALRMGFEKFFVDLVEAGKEADAILEYAQKIDADLILMNNKEKEGLGSILFGNRLTESLIKKMSPPVLAVSA